MAYEIENEFLTVSVGEKGGELQSVKDRKGHEYLWQGNPSVWKSRDVNLFPYIGRLTDGQYQYRGRSYNMTKHGFIRGAVLDEKERGGNFVTLSYRDCEDTVRKYPFKFEYEVEHRLEENALKVTYMVKNNDDITMHFALGGHPGFIVPMENGLSFDDYWVELDKGVSPMRVGFTEDCYVSGFEEEFKLEEGGKIPLTHRLFDDDAVVLKNAGSTAEIKSSEARSVKLFFEGFSYLGLWHVPQMEANYVCLEPWTSLPSRKGIVEDLEKQKGLVSLEPGKTYEVFWKAEFK